MFDPRAFMGLILAIAAVVLVALAAAATGAGAHPGLQSVVPPRVSQTDPRRPVTLARSVGLDGPVRLRLPEPDNHRPGVVRDDGSIRYTDREGLADFVVRAAPAPVAGVSAIIRSARAATQWPFRFDLPDAVTLVGRSDGAVDLTYGSCMGQPPGCPVPPLSVRIGHVFAPGAVDARREPVPTRLRIDGDTVRLVVRHTVRATAYPVRASLDLHPDPWDRWRLFLSRREAQQARKPALLQRFAGPLTLSPRSIRSGARVLRLRLAGGVPAGRCLAIAGAHHRITDVAQYPCSRFMRLPMPVD